MTRRSALIKFNQTITGKRKYFHGAEVNIGGTKIIHGATAKIERTGPKEPAKIRLSPEAIDLMEQAQIKKRAERLMGIREHRELLKRSKAQLNPSLNSARRTLFEKYGFEVINLEKMGPAADMNLTKRVAEKIIQKHSIEMIETTGLGSVKIHEMNKYEELGFLVCAMDAMRGKKFGDKLADYIEQRHSNSGLGVEISPLLRMTIDSFRGRITPEAAKKVIANNLHRPSLLAPLALSGIDLRKVEGFEQEYQSLFHSDVFHQRFDLAAKNPILNGPMGNLFSAMLKLAIQTREELKKENIFTLERYQGNLRGWTLLAIAQGIINSGGKVPRII